MASRGSADPCLGGRALLVQVADLRLGILQRAPRVLQLGFDLQALRQHPVKR